MFALALAATAAASPQPSQADLQDTRCVAVFASLSDMAEKPEDREKMLVGALYYVGKLDGRSPGFDLKGALVALVSQPDYATRQLRADAERCGAEMKARGAELQNLGKAIEKGG